MVQLPSQLFLAEGWSCYGGEYYYYVDGEPYSGWVGEYFVDNGCMQREKVIGVDGENIFCGWIWSSSEKQMGKLGEVVMQKKMVRWQKMNGLK